MHPGSPTENSVWQGLVVGTLSGPRPDKAMSRKVEGGCFATGQRGEDLEGGGFGYMDLDQIIYVHTVTRRKAVGGYFARGHRREDLGVGREPLANAMSLPATRPTDTGAQQS